MGERRDHGGVGVPGCLARPEHVEEAERKRPQPVAVLPGERVLLRGELADCVRAERLGDEVLTFRQCGVRAIDRRRRRHDHDRIVERAGGFEHPQRAGRIGLVAGDGIDDRTGHRRARCQVDDRIGAGDGLGERVGFENRPLDEANRDAVEIRLRAGRQVVDPDDLVATRMQPLAHVRTDEASCSRDEYSHRPKPTDHSSVAQAKPASRDAEVIEIRAAAVLKVRPGRHQ